MCTLLDKNASIKNPFKSSGKFITAFKEKAQHDRASEQCVDLGFDLVKPESAIENQEINDWLLMNNFYLSFWLRTQQGTVARTSPSQTVSSQHVSDLSVRTTVG